MHWQRLVACQADAVEVLVASPLILSLVGFNEDGISVDQFRRIPNRYHRDQSPDVADNKSDVTATGWVYATTGLSFQCARLFKLSVFGGEI